MKKEDFKAAKDSLMSRIINKISAKTLRMNEYEIKKLSKLLINQPQLTKASLTMASLLKCKMDWDIIMNSLTILTMDSINYDEIVKEVEEKLPWANNENIIKEVEELAMCIMSIVIENNRSELIKVESLRDSRYRFSIICFRKLMNGEIALNEFYNDVSDIVVSTIKNSINNQNYNHLAV